MQSRAGMQDLQDQEAPVEDKPASAFDRTIGFARAHPGVSLIAAAGVGLFGGLELAAGMLFGAGIYALVGDGATRARASSMLGALPQKLRDRARSMTDSMRSRISPQDAADRAAEPDPHASGAI